MSTPIDKVAAGVMVVGASGTGGSSIWLWLGENHHQIAVLFGFCSLLIGAAGLVVHWYYAAKRSRPY